MRKKKATSTLLTDSALSLTDLKTRSMQELMELAEQYEIENASSMRKQELIFALLSTCASQMAPFTVMACSKFCLTALAF